MIILYRLLVSQQADSIEAELRDMLLGFEVRIVDPDQVVNIKIDNYPLINDSGRTIRGEQSIKQYLEELREFAADWCWYESDSCYIAPDGNSC